MKHLGLTANRLAKIVANLERENARLREENERLIKTNTPSMINTDVLKQYSKERIVELAMYWYEEAVYCENKYEELQRKIKAMEGVC